MVGAPGGQDRGCQRLSLGSDHGMPSALIGRMDPDQERWAEALQVLNTPGAGSEAFIVERRLALVNDPAGRERCWQKGHRVAQIGGAAGRSTS